VWPEHREIINPEEKTDGETQVREGEKQHTGGGDATIQVIIIRAGQLMLKESRVSKDSSQMRDKKTDGWAY